MPRRHVFGGSFSLESPPRSQEGGTTAPLPPSASPPEPRPCAIKLVAGGCYGEDAHRAAAAAGVAPALHGVARLPGGWVVVVMELLPPTGGWRQYSAHDASQREAALAACQRGVHAAGFVDGDLRAANVLVRRQRRGLPLPPHSEAAQPPPPAEAAAAASPASSSPPWDVRLLDWDWAGRAGEARYPLTRNPALAWAPGSEPCGPICAAHGVCASAGVTGGGGGAGIKRRRRRAGVSCETRVACVCKPFE